MEDVLEMLGSALISSYIKKLIEDDELNGFIAFGREQAKKDGMDNDDIMKFFDDLEAQFCNNIDWIEVADIIQKTTGCNVKIFNGDKTIIIENEKFSDLECLEYLEEKESKINLQQLNNALATVNVKLEFVEALNLPFDFDGFENFIRFKVVELDK